ncbi:hypothetical protein R3W88_020465 [Solanum pinnatisectum]|uniref:VQ domain-containing protein n=1 Tax=Solanum pinnatisectum TaxID=50273 RepID=A0AAV9KN42_9SOLN|nr:hypothetical protein R3W88_020465 [Solanum pinnatisectum]
MGKKASKSQKKQFNDLIKLLKPKVYITPSSNFKNLVQHLTGNNNIGSSSSSSPPPPLPDDDHRLKIVQEYSQELSVDSSEGSIPSSINISNTTLHEPCFSLLDNSSNNNYSMGSQEILMDDNISEEYYYRNIESWLLEMDSYTTNNYDHDQYEQVSIDDYGYDLSTLFET